MSCVPANAGTFDGVRRARASHTARRAWSRLAALFFFGTFAGCVTTYETVPLFGTPDLPPPEASAVTIPFGSEGAAPGVLGDVYRSVLVRMQELVKGKERDLPQLESLLARYDRPGLPASVAAAMASYRTVAHGWRCLDQLRANARVEVSVGIARDGADGIPARAATPKPAASGATTTAVAEVPGLAPPPVPAVPPIGAPVRFELVATAGAEPIMIGGDGSDDTNVFAVVSYVEDAYVDGSTRSWKHEDMVTLPADCDLRGSTTLQVPVQLDAPGGEAVRRRVRVCFDLLPGFLHCGTVRAPIRRTRLGETTITQHPRGYEAITAAPLAQLRQALAVFAPRDFPRAWLAAQATTGAERSEAMGLLIDQVRLGRPEQAAVAMATLSAMTDGAVPIGDREGWLAWWQRRR